MTELRQAFRSLWRSPGFTLVAIFTLALGLAGALALATVVHGVILKPLPYPEPHRLAVVTRFKHGLTSEWICSGDAQDLQTGSSVCQDLLLFEPGESLALETGDRVSPVSTLSSDWDLLKGLGVRPALGRLFLPSDDLNAIVLSFEAWQRNFGGDPTLAGRSILLNGKPRLVLGVASKGLRIPFEPLVDVFTLLKREPTHRGFTGSHALIRLKPGATLGQLKADLAARSKSLVQVFPAKLDITYGAEDLQTFTLGDRPRGMLLALGLAMFLLLIACVNVAHLFLARSLERRHELALRCALGASRSELLRHHMAEGLGVGIPAAILGLGGAWMMLKGLPALLPALPDLVGLRPDGWEIGLAILLVLVTSLAFALLPMRQSQDPRMGADLQNGTRSNTSRGKRTRAALIVAESALAVLMLAMGGLFLSSFLKALNRDPGYHFQKGVAFRLELPTQRYANGAARCAMLTALQARLEALPGVHGSACSTGLPSVGRSGMSVPVHALPIEAPQGEWPVAHLRLVTPGFFAQMGIPITKGRDIQPMDRSGAPPVVVLSEQAARQLFPEGHPLGQRIQIGGQDTTPFEVIGLCGDVISGDRRREASSHIYLSLPQASMRQPSVEVALSTKLSPEALRPHLEAQLKALDPHLPIQELLSLETLALENLSELRLITWLLGLFAGVGLFLGFFGVASVISSQVARRTREIGLRMALGASMGRVLSLVLGQAMAQVGLGALLGTALALSLGRVVASQLFNTAPTDPWVLAGAALLFCATAALASLVPALRAARVNPSEALRIDT